MTKKTIRPIFLWLSVVGLAFSLVVPTAFEATAAEKIEGPLFVESFGGAYAETTKKYIIEPFQKKYGIEVRHSLFGNNSEQLAKLKAGKMTMDVTFLTDMWIYQAIKDDLLLPLRLENIPNYKHIFKEYKNPPYDPGPKTYCASYFWGDQAIAWNTKKCDKPLSWGALWDKRYKGHVAIYALASPTIPNVALLLGQDMNNISDMEAIKEKLRALRPNLLKFWKSGAELVSLFATNEVWISDFWRGRVNNLRKEGHPIVYTQPKEGSVVWVDAMVIPKDARHRRAAEEFINFALSQKVHTDFVTHFTYAPCTDWVELTEQQKDLMGARPEILANVKFQDPEYLLKNRDSWNQIMNELMSGM